MTATGYRSLLTNTRFKAMKDDREKAALNEAEEASQSNGADLLITIDLMAQQIFESFAANQRLQALIAVGEFYRRLNDWLVQNGGQLIDNIVQTSDIVNSEMKRLEQRAANAETALDKARQETQALEASASTATRLQTAKEAADREVERLEAEKINLEQKLGEAQADLDDLRNRSTEIKQPEVNPLTSANRTLTSENTRLKEELKEEQKKTGELQAQATELTDLLEQTKTERNVAQAMNRTLDREKKGLEAALATSEAAKTAAEAEANGLREQMNTATDKAGAVADLPIRGDEPEIVTTTEDPPVPAPEPAPTPEPDPEIDALAQDPQHPDPESPSDTNTSDSESDSGGILDGERLASDLPPPKTTKVYKGGRRGRTQSSTPDA